MAELPIYYERIERVWLQKASKVRLEGSIASHGYDWNHSSFKWLKVTLKNRLRKRQQDRCCYCRRALLFNKGLVEIEHILDKGRGKYERFTFELRNLALSCKDCNNAKGTKSVLAGALSNVDPYPENASAFLWVHPHIHQYSEHIIIHQGWVYEAKNRSKEGLAVIEKCFLKDLRSKERKNREVLVGGALDMKDAVLRAASMATDVGVDKLCRELGRGLAKRWNSTPAKVEAAIKSVYDSVQKLNI
ncbi:HNH endonuclease [Variovorax boronicumulans]|uniref:HNH endonuclease n=1 Tax=Variovorax boronicumulans TaxID=436515 RepID=UPI0012E6A853|nr:hypothetical protein [Variovorax boronicumulans]GER20087.1 hypothetical protein VCH24_51240 [Variovorax boronicumulans]